MPRPHCVFRCGVLFVMFVTASTVEAQPAPTLSEPTAERLELGVKISVNISQVGAVSDFYRTEFYRPDDPIADSSGAGIVVGGFVIVPVKGRFGLQGDLVFSQKHHHAAVPDFRATFTRQYVEAAVLPRFNLSGAPRKHVYAMAGPVFGFKVGADFKTDDPTIVRGDPYYDIYYVTALPYGTPELLRSTQISIAVAGGVMIGRILLELRFTQGLQSIFKDRADVLDDLVRLGGYRPSLDESYLRHVAPIFDRAKSSDLSLVFGFRILRRGYALLQAAPGRRL